MTFLEEFETLLKDVVHAKRLSASKMDKLSAIAIKSMADDTQLVSILYRTHKSLTTGSKVSSLYVFDALARAARSQATKRTLDPKSSTGNSATFLRKLEGVLDGLFQDMVSSGTTESKEKTRKILDIWTKGNTFPSAVLSRLDGIVKRGGKEPEVKPVPTTDPRTSAQAQSTTPTATPPPQVPPVPATNIDPQAALLALLTQAANAAAVPNGQTIPNNTFAPAPALDISQAAAHAVQLQLLQQLTRTAQLSQNIPPQPHPIAPTPQIHNSFSSPVGGPSQQRSPPPFRNNNNNSAPRENGYDRFEYNSERGRQRSSDPRQDPRNNDNDSRQDPRSNDPRPAYRTNYSQRGSYTNSNSRFSRDDRSPPPRRDRRSRSRSPPIRHLDGAAVRRDTRPYSPPRQPSVTREPPASGPTKDEFGRDIRSESPPAAQNGMDEQRPSIAHVSPPPSEQPRTMPAPVVSPVEPLPAQMSLSPPVAGSANTKSSQLQSESLVGLEMFNPMTFDPTNPLSWEMLGKMWLVTHGSLPSQDALMQFVMGAAMMPEMSGMASQGWQQQQQQVQPPVQQSNWPSRSGNVIQVWEGSDKQPAAAGRGPSYSNSTWRGASAGHSTDAIVLGGGSSEASPAVDSHEPPTNAGGRMKKVGEKWVFVRDTPQG